MTEERNLKTPEVLFREFSHDSPIQPSPRVTDSNLISKVSFLTSLRRFPRNGAIGLAGSAFTVILSWLTLFLFNNHPVVSAHMLKPPAWTSIITSMNSYFIQMAVQQGISVSWWQRATSERITVDELHENWLLGSGIVSALGSGKKFNVVALATIFVFTVPLNGLLLANAVSLVTVNRQSSNSAKTNFLMAPSLPLGYSGLLDSDGGIEGYTSLWQNAIPSIFSSNSRAVFLSPIAGDKHTTCEGSCNATLRGVGFSSSCKNSQVPYDLPTDSNPSNPDYNAAILQISLTWNAKNSNIINLMTTNKRHSSCVGHFEVTNCALKMAKVSYAVNVQKNITGHGNFWWSFYNGVDSSGGSSTYQPLPVIEHYGISPNEGLTNSTFGGIAQVLAAYYNTSTMFQSTSTSNSTSLDLNGIYAQQVPPTYPAQGLGYNKCNTSYSQFTTPIPATSGTYKNITDAILTSLQHIFFFTSISAASSLSQSATAAIPETYIQTSSTNNDITSHEIYEVSWRYWWASFIITFGIIAFILPIYYGWWRLEGEKSMSPLATSKVFARVEGRSEGVEGERERDWRGGGDEWGGRIGSQSSVQEGSSGWMEMQRPRRTRLPGDGKY